MDITDKVLDEMGDKAIDDKVLGAVLSQTTQQVERAGSRPVDIRQSHTARAWTRGGQVD